MTENHSLGVPLGQTTRAVIRKQRLIVPAVVQMRPGGMNVPGCERHLFVFDLANGVAWLTPCNGAMVGELRKALDAPDGQ